MRCVAKKSIVWIDTEVKDVIFPSEIVTCWEKYELEMVYYMNLCDFCLYTHSFLLLSCSGIKEISTAIHFAALIGSGLLWIVKSDHTTNCFIAAGVTFCLAFFIPPTGMIKPDEAPEYTKNTMTYMPSEQMRLQQEREEAARKEKEQKVSGKKSNKKKKK